MQDLEGRVAVVTGAASGIGRAMAEGFAAEGMKVVLADIEETVLGVAATELKDRGYEVLPVQCDVANPQAVDLLAQQSLDAFGAVHILCNNAGVVAAGGNSWERTLDDWRWTLSVNLWGTIHGIRTFVPIFLDQGSEAHIINTASMAGLITMRGMSDYCVTKHGVVALSETLHQELRATTDKVKVSVLCPGWVNTRIMDAERNRDEKPRTVPGLTPEAEEMHNVVRKLIEDGLSPSEIAAQVLRAIREERFYILTHPDWMPMIQNRMDAILNDGQPQSPM